MQLRNPLIRILLLSLVLIADALAKDNDQAAVVDWMQRMVNAVHSLNYTGTFVFLHDNQLESMQIHHVADASGERERLLSLNGVAREVFRDDASVTCVAPDSKFISIGKRVSGYGLGTLFSKEHGSVTQHYDFKLAGQARVADRPVQVIGILPKDGLRYGYRIYIDQQHNLPLKTDVVDVDGNAVSQLMFTQIDVDEHATAMTETSLEGKEDYAWLQHNPRRAGTRSGAGKWQFRDLPSGFGVSFHSRSGERGGSGLDHFVLSDGLAALSVYIETGSESGLVGGSTMGTVNAFGRSLAGYHVTVVGEVPAQTVEQIAMSVHTVQKP